MNQRGDRPETYLQHTRYFKFIMTIPISTHSSHGVTPRGAFEYLFHHHPLPMWIFDSETLRFLIVNRAAVEKYGYTESEFLSMSLTDIRPIEERVDLENYVKSIRPELASAGIWRHKLKDGSIVMVEVTSHALEWSGRPSRLVMIQDVTAREKAIRDLKESESVKAAILEHALDSIVTMNELGMITDFNPAAEITFGWTREHVLGKTVADLLIPEENREAHKLGLKRYLSTNESRMIGRRIEVDALRADGTCFPIELSINSARNNAQTTFTAFLRDISERRNAEEALARLNRDLELKIADRTHQLEAMNHELEAFSYSVSHDLRSPLRAIDGFSEALVEDCGTELSLQAKRYLERIQSATKRMSLLIDDLITLARVSKSEINIQQIDLSILVTEIIDELRERDPNRKVSLQLAQPLWAYADLKLMRVAFINLLQNAWKFTSKRETAWIRVGEIESHNERIFFVQDNGAGFDMTYASKLFAPFQRLHDSRDYEGTGIGLATIHRIITLHGGRVWAEAEPDKGAMFHFSLPAPRAGMM